MNAQDFREMHTMIASDLATSRQLLALLEAESASTKTRDYTALSALLEEKKPLIETLQKNAAIRTQWLHSLNKQANENNWTQLLQSLEDQDMHKQWQTIKHTIAHCQKINDMNGKLIQRGLHSHAKLLQIMRGKPRQTGLYNAKGTTHAITQSRRVIHA